MRGRGRRKEGELKVCGFKGKGTEKQKKGKRKMMGREELTRRNSK